MGRLPGYPIPEYLERERTALDRHEYRDGEVIQMAGSSGNHSLIVANLCGEIGNRLKGNPCRVYNSGLRIRVPPLMFCTYADLTVICGRVQTDPDDPAGETIINPRLIVEVYSPATETYDRGEKFSRYQRLDSLQEYVLVTQAAAQIEVLSRQPDGTWLFSLPFSGLESVAKLRSLDVLLPLSEVYAGVEFPPTEDGVIVPM